MTVLLIIILGLTVSNVIFLYQVFYYVNRNWESLLDIRNDISTLDKTIYYSRKRGE